MITLILTINDDTNYGNRLQNYALMTILSNYGSSFTIRTFLDRDQATNSLTHRFLHFKRSLKYRLHIEPDYREEGKRKACRCFTDKYVPDSSFFVSSQSGLMPKIVNEDYRIVIGSDQVWNYMFGLSPSDLKLRFGFFEKPCRLLSYAASFGVEAIDERMLPIVKEGLNRIPSISVREIEAAELVYQVSGKQAEVVLDPTLLLSREDWSAIARQVVDDDVPYILTYFLGTLSRNQEQMIIQTAIAMGCKIVRLNDSEDSRFYSVGPAEFVGLFSGAKYVFTDSYHACCFSIVFNVGFKVFNRAGFADSASMNSRMRTLFHLFKIEDLMNREDELVRFDWGRINSLLDRHRTKSIQWLEDALSASTKDCLDA